MRAGRLRHRVKLQRNEAEQNTMGEPVPVWVVYATVDAEVDPLKGNEFFGAQQINAELTTRVRVRWRPDIKAGDQIIFRERILLIATPPINVYEKNHELVLMCRELT